MDLRKLEHFEAVSRLKSFTRAAEELHVSQPSITTSIKKFEAELGVQLLLRTNNEITLTEAGKVLRERAIDILAQVNSSFIEMRDLGTHASKHLRFAAPTALGSWIFPLLFTSYVNEYPDVKITALERGVTTIRDMLTKDIIDLGFVVLDSEDSEQFKYKYFSTGQLYAILPINHHLSAQSKIDFAKLARERLILPYGAGYLHNRFKQECMRCNIESKITFSPLQVITTFNTVASGGGVSIVLDDKIATIQNNPQIAVRPFAEPLYFDTGFIWLRKKYLPNIAKEFISFLEANQPDQQ